MPRKFQPFQQFFAVCGFQGLASKPVFDGPQLHQEVRANPSDFLRHGIARHSHVMKVTEGTPNQKINLRFAEGGVLVREEEPESVGPANIMDGRDTGSGGAVELDRSQVKAIAQKLF